MLVSSCLTRMSESERASLIRKGRAEEIQKRLERNRRRREKARGEVDKARDELAGLLNVGRDSGLDVRGMSRRAGISRETAHQLLRRARDGT